MAGEVDDEACWRWGKGGIGIEIVVGGVNEAEEVSRRGSGVQYICWEGYVIHGWRCYSDVDEQPEHWNREKDLEEMIGEGEVKICVWTW